MRAGELARAPCGYYGDSRPPMCRFGPDNDTEQRRGVVPTTP
jgi:hypothetical protein